MVLRYYSSYIYIALTLRFYSLKLNSNFLMTKVDNYAKKMLRLFVLEQRSLHILSAVTSMRLLKDPKKLCVQETSPSLTAS